MPKLKSKSGAKKRFQLTYNGNIKRKHAFKNHILTKKTPKRKKRLTQFTLVNRADFKNIKRQLLP
ncbi:MAG TPA: 50S ribosomal protein L35 [Blattabacteriaceae bacterium]